MSTQPMLTAVLAMNAVLVASLAAAGTPPQFEADAAPRQARLAAFKAKGAKAAITVLPVLLDDRPLKEVGDALALCLEQQAGLDDMASTAAAFKPDPASAVASLPQRLGEHVRKNPVGSDYALFAQLVVLDRKFTEVRVVVVDHDGGLVWTDTQHAGDADFDRIKPAEPLECCSLVAERVRGLLGLAVPSARRDGKMARAWAEKSGTPSEAVVLAMRERQTRFAKQAKDARLLVFPVRIAGELDAAEAGVLAKLFSEHGLGRAISTDMKPSVEITASSNEQRALWDLARSLHEHLVKNPVDADYAMIAEYVMDRERQRVAAVHFVVCSRAGEWVIVDFQNDHHEDFQAVSPSGVAGCRELLLRRVEGYVRQS
ncbi:MAG: hypothetical protein U1E76_22830 [Planctomycetota bacterium]